MPGSGVVTCNAFRERSHCRCTSVRAASARSGLRIVANESMNLRQTVRLTQRENHFSRLTRSQRQFRRHSGAGIEGWARVAGQPHALQGGGHCNRAVLPEKFRTIGGDRLRRRTGGHERDLSGEGAGPGIPRQYRGALRIALAHDLQRSVFTHRSKNPFSVIRRRQAPEPVAVISHRQAHQLDRIVGRYENQKVLIEITTDMRVASVALAVMDGHRCPGSQGQGRGSPEVTGFIVAQIDHFA